MRALNALLLNGAPFLPGKMSADPAKLTPPPRRSRTPLTLSRGEWLEFFLFERR